MRKIIFIFLLLCGFTQIALAQFHYTGVSSSRIKWNKIETDKYRLIYPSEFAVGAQRYSALLDSVYPWINYNFDSPVRKIPVILRTGNLQSNGYVVWAPKREEMVTNLAGNTYALSWAKQVSIHEARHVAQMSTLKTGMTKAMTWFLGEAGISVGLLVVSKWQLEGDATLAETQFAEYGRGLQPEFTLGYRGLAADGKLDFKNLDPWVAGSYKHYVPGIYEFGYQVMSAAETYLSPTITYEVLRYSAKYPILISPRTIYLKKHYKTDYKEIAQRAFAELDSLWKPTYSIPNSFDVITSRPKLHTNYTNPLPYGDKIVATKWDMNKPSRFIVIDTATMDEKLLRSIGNVTSRPIIHNDKLYWTEYKPHPVYEQENFSVIRSIDINTRKREVYNRNGVNYYITPLPGDRFATVTLDKQSDAYIRITDSTFSKELKTIHFENEPTTLHGLTWDEKTSKFYFIALSDRGMWIGSVTEDGAIEEITVPSVVTVQDLRADNGKLYFSSIQSGKNEIHVIDLATGKESRQTTSQLGSVSPASMDTNSVLFSAYTPRGWAIAKSGTSDSLRVAWSRLPMNTLNPKRYKWDVPSGTNLVIPYKDSLNYKETKRYRRAPRSMNVHSWAPIPFTGDLDLIENSPIQIAFGATAFFQSPTSELRGFASYGWVSDMSWMKASAIYSGLPVQLEINAEYGGGYQSVYYPTGEIKSGVADPKLKPYVGVSAKFSVPLNLSKGANYRLFEPSITIGHYNSKYYNREARAYGTDVRIYNASIYWSDIRAKGYRSLMPRLGYSLRTTAVGAINKDFSTIVALTARGYLPGFAQTHSLTFAATGQYQFEHNQYKLTSKSLVPRGVTNNNAAKNYAALQSSYMMPVAYPEWGWDGMFYLRRIYAELFFDYSSGSYFDHTLKGTVKLNHHSTGAVIRIDNNLLCTLPNTISLTVARTSLEKFWFGASISFEF